MPVFSNVLRSIPLKAENRGGEGEGGGVSSKDNAINQGKHVSSAVRLTRKSSTDFSNMLTICWLTINFIQPYGLLLMHSLLYSLPVRVFNKLVL